MFSAIIFVIVICLVIRKFLIPSSTLRHYGDKIPGPKSYPIIGNSLVLWTPKTLLQLITDLSETYGPVCRLWLGKSLFLLLSDPKDIESILSSTKNLNKSDAYRFLDSWMGKTNLITSEVGIWQAHRKLLTPSFHFKILENSVEMILRNVEILCDKLQTKVDQEEFNIQGYVEKCSLDIICETAMGTRLETQSSERNEYLDALKTVCAITAKRFFYPWLQPEFLFNISKYGQICNKNVKIIKAEGFKVINERKKALLNNKEAFLKSQEEGKKHLAFLDFLLMESNFTDDEIENEVQAFMVAGYDTITVSISFCLYELSNNQHVQNKLVREIKDIWVSKRGNLSYKDFLNMRYLDYVIKESMRIYTTIPLFSRKVTEQVELPSGYVLPVGSLINFNVHHMHRNEKYFPNADQFLPERFEVKDANRHPCAYLPFSTGPRNCIGQKFAMIEMKITIFMILLKFQFLPIVNVEPRLLETGLVLCSLNDLPLRLKRRDLESI